MLLNASNHQRFKSPTTTSSPLSISPDLGLGRANLQALSNCSLCGSSLSCTSRSCTSALFRWDSDWFDLRKGSYASDLNLMVQLDMLQLNVNAKCQLENGWHVTSKCGMLSALLLGSIARCFPLLGSNCLFLGTFRISLLFLLRMLDRPWETGMDYSVGSADWRDMNHPIHQSRVEHLVAACLWSSNWCSCRANTMLIPEPLQFATRSNVDNYVDNGTHCHTLWSTPEKVESHRDFHHSFWISQDHFAPFHSDQFLLVRCPEDAFQYLLEWSLECGVRPVVDILLHLMMCFQTNLGTWGWRLHGRNRLYWCHTHRWELYGPLHFLGSAPSITTLAARELSAQPVPCPRARAARVPDFLVQGPRPHRLFSSFSFRFLSTFSASMGRLRAAEREWLRRRAHLSTPSSQRHCTSRVRRTMIIEKMTIITESSLWILKTSLHLLLPFLLEQRTKLQPWSVASTEAAFWTSSFDPEWIIFFASFSSSFCGSFWTSDCGTSTIICISCFSCLRRSEASGLVSMSAVILIPDMCWIDHMPWMIEWRAAAARSRRCLVRQDPPSVVKMARADCESVQLLRGRLPNNSSAIAPMVSPATILSMTSTISASAVYNVTKLWRPLRQKTGQWPTSMMKAPWLTSPSGAKLASAIASIIITSGAAPSKQRPWLTVFFR